MNISDYLKSLWFEMNLTDIDLTLNIQKRRKELGSPLPEIKALSLPNTSRVWGFDCSHWSGYVDMQKAKNNGASFVFIKGKDGTATSKYFVENYASAKSTGILRGVYCWLYPSDKISVTTQVNSWWNLIKSDQPDFPIVIDYEWTYYGGYPANPGTNDLRAAVNGIYSLSGRKPIVYTSVGYVGDVGAIPQDIIDNTSGVWAAHYYVTNPLIPPKYTSWIFHQWTDQMDGSFVGYNPSYSIAADGDYWNGTIDELYEFAGGATPPPPPPPNPTSTEYFRNKQIEITHGTHNSGTYEFDYHILKVAKKDIKRIYTTPGPIKSKDLTENFLVKNNLHIASNMDEVIKDTLSPKGWGVANGVMYKNTTEETGVQFDSNHKILGMAWNRLSGSYNIACGSNILVENGQAKVINNPSADPRTILAYNDKFIFLFMVDGRKIPGKPGVTLTDVANFIAYYGSVYEATDGKINAHNFDGGGSSRASIIDDNGETYTFNVPSEVRPVINHFGIELVEPVTPPPPPPPEPETGMKAIQYLYGSKVKTWVQSDKYSPAELIVREDTDTRLIPKAWANKEYFRVKKDQETNKYGGGVRNAAPAPAVWVVSDTAYQMGKSLQLFCADLLALSKFGDLYKNLPSADKSYIGSAYRGVYDYTRAFNNGTGYNDASDPRADYVNEVDLDAPLPRFDKIRVCSDDIISGVVDGELKIKYFTSVPKNYGIEILNDPRVFRATIIRPDGQIRQFPQLDGAPVYVPLISNYQLSIPIGYVEKQ